MKELWYDLTQIKDDRKLYLSYALQQGYKGIYIDKECLDLISVIPEEVKIIYDYPFLKDDKYFTKRIREKKSDNSVRRYAGFRETKKEKL